MYRALVKALSLLVCLNAIVSASSLNSTSVNTDNHGALDEILQQYVDAQLQSYNLARQKRGTNSRQLYRDTGGIWIVENFRNQPGCPRATKQFKVFTSNTGNHYAVIATNAEENNTEIYSFTKEKGCDKLLDVLPTRSAFDFVVIPGKETVRIVTLEQNPLKLPHLRTGSTVYSLTLNNLNVSVSREEVLRSEHPTCLTSWEQNGSSHLAICDGKSRDALRGFSTVCSVYRYSRGYFDQYDEIPTHLPQSIAHFRIYSKHYLAIANRPHESELEDVPTEILRYDLGLETYRHMQFLPTKGAKDICFFTLGSGLDAEFFLVVINEFSFGESRRIVRNATSFIYKFVDERFEPFQSIPLNNQAIGCAVYQGNSEQVALVISMTAGVEVFQYNGWRFVQTLEYSKHALGQGISRLNVALSGPETLLIAANSNPTFSDADNVFTIKFSDQHHTTVAMLHEKNLNTCQQTRLKLKGDPICLLLSLYGQAIKKNDTNINLGRVEFRNLTATKIITNEVYVKSNSSRLGIQQITQLQKLADRISLLTSQLEVLSFKVKNAIRTNGNYTISGDVKIRNLKARCENGCQINTSQAKNINKVNLQTLFEQVIKSTDKYLPSVNVSRLTVHQLDTSALSNKPIEQFIKTDENATLDGGLKVRGNAIFNSELHVKGLIDNCTVSPSDVLLREGHQNLDWDMKVNTLHAADVEVENLNGQNINQLYKNTLTLGARLTLKDPRFRSLEAKTIKLDGLVNGIDLNELTSNAVKLTGDQLVTGKHVYESVDLGKVLLQGKLNGLNFPRDFLTVNKGDVLKTKHLKLTNDAVFSKLKIASTIGELRIGSIKNFAGKFLVKSSNQTQNITGSKTFGDIKTASTISSLTLNGAPMDKFDTDNALYGDPKQVLHYDSVDVQGSLTFEKALSVAEIVGADLDRINLSIPVNAEEFPQMQSLTFTNNLQITGDLSPKLLDGVPTSVFLMKNSSESIIFKGLKTFTQSVSMNTLTLGHTLNGFVLNDLWKQALKIEGDQTLSGILSVKGDLDAKRLQAASLSLIPVWFSGNITGEKQFQNLTIEGDWHASSFNITGTFNEIDVNSWPIDTIIKGKRDQVIKSKKSFKSISVSNLSLVAVDDENIDELLSVIKIGQPVVIHSDVIFQGPVIVGHLDVKGTIDGVDSNAPLYWLKYDDNQVINGSIQVEGRLTVTDYRQNTWLVNEIDLKEFLDRALHTDDIIELASLKFGHMVVENLEVEGLVQGVNVSSDLALKSSEEPVQKIGGRKSFAAPLTSESLTIYHELNGHEPEIACHSNVPPQSSDWVIYGNVIVKESSRFDVVSINNRTLTEVVKNAWIKDEDVVMEWGQVFNHATFNEVPHLDVISGINLTDLSRKTVSLNSPIEQRVNAIHYYESVEVETLEVDKLKSPHINGVRIEDLQENVLRLGVKQEIPGTFAFENVVVSDVEVEGLVNDIDINTDVARKDRVVSISGFKTLENLIVKKDVEMCPGCLVGSYDLSDWARRAILQTGSYTLPGARFESVAFQQPIKLSGQLNGVTVTKEHIMTRSDPQIINGPISIHSHLPAGVPYPSKQASEYHKATEEFTLASRFDKLQVNGLYSGVDLVHFYDRAIRENANVTLTKPIVLSSLVAQEIEDSASASTLRDIVKPDGTFHTAATQLAPFNSSESIPLSSLVRDIEKIVSHHAFELKFFEEIRPNRDIPHGAFAAHAWESFDGDIQLSIANDQGQVFSTLNDDVPILDGVQVKGMASSVQAFGDLVIATRSKADGLSKSIIISMKENLRIQEIPTVQPLSCASFTLSNQSCFVFLEKEPNSPVYCRSFSEPSYKLAFELPIREAHLMVPGYTSSNEPPILTISKQPMRGMSQVQVWKFFPTIGTYQPWKNIASLEIHFMDSICDESACLLATVAPSKPAAIPGQVIIWSLTDKESPTRLQRIPLAEPIQVKFAILPDGRKLLIVLQSSGVDNVSVFIQREMQQFRLVTTVRVPGARDLKIVVGQSNVTLVFSTSSLTASPYAPVRLFRARFLGLFL